MFCSLQGEARSSGVPTAFIRLTGCPLRCVYCDTAYAFHGGQWRSIESLLAEVGGFGVRHVCVTGGEPLAQGRCLKLLCELCDRGYQVSLETSGAFDISEVDVRVARVVDIKTPGSGEVERNLDENYAHLKPGDQLKYVICDRADFDWACAEVAGKKLAERWTVWFSPSYEQVKPGDLADWILAEGAPVRFQMQLHKALWGDVPGR